MTHPNWHNIHKKKSREDWIIHFNIKHNSKYVYDKFIPRKPSEKVIITCLKHGDFLMRSNLHSAGRGCTKCYLENAGKQNLKSKETWLKEFHLIHKDTYNYDKFELVNGYTKIIVTCKKHGDFLITPTSHRGGCGCPTCRISKGERAIKHILDLNNISFIPQKRFDDCKDKLTLPFDFYLPQYNVLIEYQGQQHFYGTGYGKMDRKLEYYKKHDKIKKEYCLKNNIPLFEVTYLDNIEESMNKIIHNLLRIPKS